MATYYKVGELAKLYHISTDTLRYYEDLGLLQPRRAANGYREYATGDIWRLNVIRDLRAMGFSMEHIQTYFAAHTLDSALTLLDEELRVADQRIRELAQLRANLQQRRDTLLAAQTCPVGQVRLERLDARFCHVIPQDYATDEEMDILIKRLINFDPNRLFIIGSTQIGSLVNLEMVQQRDYRRYEGVFILHPNGERCIPAGQYLTLRYRGSCAQNSRYIPQLLAYAQAHGLQSGGVLLELLCTDIHSSALLQEQLTELQLLLH